MKNGILYAAGAFLLLKLFSKVTAVRSFGYDIETLPKASIDGSRAILTIPLTVINPGSEHFPISELFARIQANGVFVGQVSNSGGFTIGPGKNVVPLNVTLELSNTVAALLGALTGSGAGTVLRIEGFLRAGPVSIPISFDKKIV